MQVCWICLSATTKRKYREKEYHVPLQISSSCIFVLSSFVLLERISSGVTSLTWVYLCIWLMLPFIYFPLQLWIISVVISFFLIHYLRSTNIDNFLYFPILSNFSGALGAHIKEFINKRFVLKYCIQIFVAGPKANRYRRTSCSQERKARYG